MACFIPHHIPSLGMALRKLQFRCENYIDNTVFGFIWLIIPPLSFVAIDLCFLAQLWLGLLTHLLWLARSMRSA